MVATPQPSPPMASISLAATTEANTSTEPMDRSMPAVMMTNVMPTPRTAHTAMFCEISEKLLADRNLPPAAMEKNDDDDEERRGSTPTAAFAIRLR